MPLAVPFTRCPPRCQHTQATRQHTAACRTHTFFYSYAVYAPPGFTVLLAAVPHLTNVLALPRPAAVVTGLTWILGLTVYPAPRSLRRTYQFMRRLWTTVPGTTQHRTTDVPLGLGCRTFSWMILPVVPTALWLLRRTAGPCNDQFHALPLYARFGSLPWTAPGSSWRANAALPFALPGSRNGTEPDSGSQRTNARWITGLTLVCNTVADATLLRGNA